MKQQKGFTLIELIIVIVILGILAVTAAPRFFDFSGKARASTVSGLASALQGAANLEYANLAINGGTLKYPDATLAGIANAAQLNADEWTITTGTDTITFAAIGANVPANCEVTYASSGTGAGAVFTVKVDVTDC